ncbi:MAG: hypothetical protein RSB03_06430, partial [Oscillospiraceae bacterium]
MRNRAYKRGADTAMITLFVVLPLAGAILLGGSGGMVEALSRAAASSVSIALPEAAVGAMNEHMQSVVGEGETIPLLPPEPQENDAQPDEPPPEPVYDEEDVVAANALVPAERRGTIEQTQYLANPSGEIYFAYGALSVRNSTEYANNEMLAAA